MPAKPRFPKRLRVMPEYSSSGIWVADAVGPFRHGMIEHNRLGIPAELAARFVTWIEWYETRLGNTPFNVEEFNGEGRALAVALKAFVGTETEVIFEGEADDGGLLAAEIIR